ncbi:MAG: hypothetical protein ACTTH7_08990 [Treponema sp.]
MQGKPIGFQFLDNPVTLNKIFELIDLFDNEAIKRIEYTLFYYIRLGNTKTQTQIFNGYPLYEYGTINTIDIDSLISIADNIANLI